MDRQLIQNHLRFCSDCRQNADDLLAVAKYIAPCRINFPPVDVTQTVRRRLNRPVEIFVPVWQKYFYKLGLAIAMLFFVLRANNFSSPESAVFLGYVIGHLIIYSGDLTSQRKFLRRGLDSATLCPQ
jgi:hypothetical protein